MHGIINTVLTFEYNMFSWRFDDYVTQKTDSNKLCTYI